MLYTPAASLNPDQKFFCTCLTVSIRRPSTEPSSESCREWINWKLTGIVGDELADPVIPHVLDILALRIQVRQRDSLLCQPAALEVARVIVVVDLTRVVEVLLVVEGIEDAVVHIATVTTVCLW